MAERLRPDALVEELVPDPAQPSQEVRALVGFLGRSAQAGCWRLYLTAQLNDYVEFREEDVVHSQSLVTEQSPLGGTMVWVKQDAKLLHARLVSARQAQAEFLQGDITAQFLSESQTLASTLSAIVPTPVTVFTAVLTIVVIASAAVCPSIEICVSRMGCPTPPTPVPPPPQPPPEPPPSD